MDLPQPSVADPLTITASVSPATPGPYFGSTTYPSSQTPSIQEGSWAGLKTPWTPDASASMTFTYPFTPGSIITIPYGGSYSFSPPPPLVPPASLTMKTPGLSPDITPLPSVNGHDINAASIACSNFPDLTISGSPRSCYSSCSYGGDGIGIYGPVFNVPNGTYTKPNGDSIPIYGGTFKVIRGEGRAIANVIGSRTTSPAGSCWNEPHWKTEWAAGGIWTINFDIVLVKSGIPDNPPSEYVSCGLTIGSAEMLGSDFAMVDGYKIPAGYGAIRIAYSGFDISETSIIGFVDQWI